VRVISYCEHVFANFQVNAAKVCYYVHNSDCVPYDRMKVALIKTLVTMGEVIIVGKPCVQELR
jgi:hypothetical protein